jgi:hypothetical protein
VEPEIDDAGLLLHVAPDLVEVIGTSNFVAPWFAIEH